MFLNIVHLQIGVIRVTYRINHVKDVIKKKLVQLCLLDCWIVKVLGVYVEQKK